MVTVTVFQSAFLAQTAWGPVSAAMQHWDSGWCLRKLSCYWWKDTFQPGDGIQLAQRSRAPKRAWVLSATQSQCPSPILPIHCRGETKPLHMIKPLLVGFLSCVSKSIPNAYKTVGKLNVYNFAWDEPWPPRISVFSLMEPRMKNSAEKHIKIALSEGTS